ncbi:MAG: GH140, partial [uncultured Thermomicrobiales bacterium]
APRERERAFPGPRGRDAVLLPGRHRLDGAAAPDAARIRALSPRPRSQGVHGDPGDGHLGVLGAVGAEPERRPALARPGPDPAKRHLLRPPRPRLRPRRGAWPAAGAAADLGRQGRAATVGDRPRGLHPGERATLRGVPRGALPGPRRDLGARRRPQPDAAAPPGNLAGVGGGVDPGRWRPAPDDVPPAGTLHIGHVRPRRAVALLRHDPVGPPSTGLPEPRARRGRLRAIPDQADARRGAVLRGPPGRLEARGGVLRRLGRAEGRLLGALRRRPRPHLRGEWSVPVLAGRRDRQVRGADAVAGRPRPAGSGPDAARAPAAGVAAVPRTGARPGPARLRGRRRGRPPAGDARERRRLRLRLSAKRGPGDGRPGKAQRRRGHGGVVRPAPGHGGADRGVRYRSCDRVPGAKRGTEPGLGADARRRRPRGAVAGRV